MDLKNDNWIYFGFWYRYPVDLKSVFEIVMTYDDINDCIPVHIDSLLDKVNSESKFEDDNLSVDGVIVTISENRQPNSPLLLYTYIPIYNSSNSGSLTSTSL